MFCEYVYKCRDHGINCSTCKYDMKNKQKTYHSYYEKYIVIKESNIVAKQTAGGIWYCSELPAKTTKELESLIGEVNKILNRYNNNVVRNQRKQK